jgi:hypothetical protein
MHCIKGLKDIPGKRKSRVITVDLKNQMTECFQHNTALGHLILHYLRNIIESIRAIIDMIYLGDRRVLGFLYDRKGRPLSRSSLALDV